MMEQWRTASSSPLATLASSVLGSEEEVFRKTLSSNMGDSQRILFQAHIRIASAPPGAGPPVVVSHWAPQYPGVARRWQLLLPPADPSSAQKPRWAPEIRRSKLSLWRTLLLLSVTFNIMSPWMSESVISKCEGQCNDDRWHLGSLKGQFLHDYVFM